MGQRTSHARIASYARHQPEQTILYRTIQEHFETFVANSKSSTGENPFPLHVYQEIDAYLKCGILSQGFLRLQCEECKSERLVAFSCKKRGFCPSCGGRRMNEVAMHLVDNVIPKVPVRQWVLSFPFSVRYLLSYNPSLITKVLAIYVRIISNWYTKAARKNGFNGKTGAVTFVQRFGSAINLNVHFHSLFLDGVYISKDDSLEFIPIFPPSNEEIAVLVQRMNLRITRYLQRKGLKLTDVSEDPFAHEEPVLAHIAGHSIQSRIGLGERAGLKVRRLGAKIKTGATYVVGERCAVSDGFSLHANVRIGKSDRAKLEKLCRYTARPPIALERMTEAPNGQILYALKNPYSDGTTHVYFDPLELVEKVVALIPPPRANLLRYHGVLAPNCKLRSKIVPITTEPKAENPYPSQTKWADLLKRTFAVDVLDCFQCQGKMKVLAVIKDPHVIKKFLESVGAVYAPPTRASPRAPPQQELQVYDPYNQTQPNPFE